MAQMTIPLTFEADRKHDLPPKWDERRVEWDGWEPTPYTTYELHAGVEPCPACQLVFPTLSTVGTVHRRTTTEDGRNGNVIALQRGPLRDLYARRCLNCNIDQVYQMSTGQLWQLDSRDYGDEGSMP